MATVPELSVWTVEKPAASKDWQMTEDRKQRTAEINLKRVFIG
jgi:hypothetical protein